MCSVVGGEYGVCTTRIDSALGQFQLIANTADNPKQCTLVSGFFKVVFAPFTAAVRTMELSIDDIGELRKFETPQTATSSAPRSAPRETSIQAQETKAATGPPKEPRSLAASNFKSSNNMTSLLHGSESQPFAAMSFFNLASVPPAHSYSVGSCVSFCG